MSLRVRLLSLLPVFYILHSTTATPLTFSPDTNTSASKPLDIGIENFAGSPTWNGTLLPSTACFMTSIFALADLALQDFTSTTKANTWTMPTFPALTISMTPPPNQNHTPVRWAIWGIGSAIETMVTKTRYETASFALSYESNPVGSVNYSTPETVVAKPEMEAASGPFGTTETEISISPTRRMNSSAPITYTLNNPASNTTTTTALNATTLELKVSFTTTKIGQESYFAAIVNALVALAPLSASERVERWSIYFPSVSDRVEIDFTAVARSSAPFLETGFLVRALGSLPGILLQRGIWREADVDVVVDGVVVCYGRVRRAARTGVLGGGGWGAANVLFSRE